MKSVKPGRGPSRQGFVSCIFMIVFGIIWTILAATMTAGAGLIGILFPLFGVCFVGLGIHNAYVEYHNAYGEDRMTLFDVVDSQEEPDPFAPNYQKKKEAQAKAANSNRGQENRVSGTLFCPYCGKPVAVEHKFCKHCGKPLD